MNVRDTSHPVALVTVNVYEPAVKLNWSSAVGLIPDPEIVVHSYVNEPAVPSNVTSIAPLLPPV